ncbi:arginine--tRNA ligase [uncultured Microscilla sp.]|uniref:arginine--tRNA ligase n=1 Tax=uncultured Microscilla sp. TaxID=432653 RepID=UPI00262A32D3|nr:arginine--tRNA ligase [uncultured Microscilla sp.]
MSMETTLQNALQQAFKELFNLEVTEVELQPTRKEFEGSHTFVMFSFLKAVRKRPDELGQMLGDYLTQNTNVVSGYNVANKGFLNISIADKVWIDTFGNLAQNNEYGKLPHKNQKVMVEYSSPNTNKPLHLGHLRNNFLGYSVAQILEAAGYDVVKANLVNDRGVHICKSMLAYQKFGEGETPESSGIKGDHLIGKYYVEFDKQMKKQVTPIIAKIAKNEFSLFTDEEVTNIRNYQNKIAKINEEIRNEQAKLPALKGQLLASFDADFQELFTNWEASLTYSSDFKKYIDNQSFTKKQQPLIKLIRRIIKLYNSIAKEDGNIKQIANNKTPLMNEVVEMLQKWEAKDPETVALWQKMNGWVYEGFDATYKAIGVDFDQMYYESETYLLGKDIIKDGLDKDLFYTKPDGSVWAKLPKEVSDNDKILLRSNGTSVYMTQDLGTADKKYEDHAISKSIYVIGNEQDYHCKVLFQILKDLDRPYADGLYHLSYGMVDLPTGKMKSREGTVIDADDLLEEVKETARKRTDDLGKLDGMSDAEKIEIYRIIALGALKYTLLRVDPKKRMLFDKESSVDFQGDAGPFVQMNYVRTRSILRKAAEMGISTNEPWAVSDLHVMEKELIKLLLQYEAVVEEAGYEYNPSFVAQYAYDLARTYSQFFAECPILKMDDGSAASIERRKFRIALSTKTGELIKKALGLLGIEVPERM